VESRQDWREINGGYWVAVNGTPIFVPDRAVYASEEPNAVFCRAYRGNECLFLPMTG
jgi:hypothetical protein